MLKTEFHCHTIYSKDSLTSPAALVQACARKGIDRVIITDHNKTGGALKAHAIDPQRVIVGEEIMTTAGEILAAFVKEEVPPGLSPLETIRRLRDQGAFISVSHPFDVVRRGHWERPALEEITPLVDAIETFNSRCLSGEHNQQAQAYALQHQLLGTVGSDAHMVSELGMSTLLLPGFDDPASLKAALAHAQPQVRLSPFWVHFYSRYSVWRKKMSPHLVPDGL